MNKDFDFQNLFVLDLANNHQGDVAHGRNVIASHGEMVLKHGVRAAFKFQFRQLNSFIHPSHHEGSSNKHIPRFLSTRLGNDQFGELLAEVRKAGLLAMCTPFDEESVAVILDMGFDIIKVASCSAKDWPLLEAVADASLPVVISTGGLLLENIDDLVSFFDHRGVDYALMHCVSIYPIPDDAFHLNQIAILRERYPHRVIGWSTHEDPNATAPVHIAVAKGARMFERHVGVATGTIQLNAYSSTPDQVNKWFEAHAAAVKICGGEGARQVSAVEQDSIDMLRRGVYARNSIKQGVTVAREQVYFAMPYVEGQLESGRWRNDITTNADFAPNSPLMGEALTIPENPDHHVIKTALHEVKALLNEARIALNSDFEVEYSHHHGVAEFRETGAVIINCINREYCKKILVQLPGQHHPLHFHKRKEETFQVLYGTLSVTVEGHERVLRPGETCLIQPGVWHSFWTETGCVFEEVSTTHYNDDSYYKEKAVNRMARSERKTIVDHWGRFELSDKATGGKQTPG